MIAIENQQLPQSVEYYEEFIKMFGKCNPPGFFNQPESWNKYYDTIKNRDSVRLKYSYAIPSPEAIKKIISLSPIIEIGAGNGYWAYEISKAGGDIIAFDNNSWRMTWTKKWFTVMQGDEQKINDFPKRTPMICWSPEFGLETIKNKNTKQFIHIGEGNGGCTNSDEFFDYLDDNYELEYELELPQWPGINDRLEIWKRVEDEINEI